MPSKQLALLLLPLLCLSGFALGQVQQGKEEVSDPKAAARAARRARGNKDWTGQRTFRKANRPHLDAAFERARQQRKHDQDDLSTFEAQRSTYPHPSAGGQQRYTREDLLVVMPSNHERLSLLEAGRSWRGDGMQAYILLEKALDERNASQSLLNGRGKYRETYGHYADVDARHIWSQPGDARAALAPFRANKTIGLENYRWILYGDDDTVWFPDNVLRLVNGLDHNMPYLLSDHMWFPEWKGRKDIFVHASRRAPRCLPCNYTDPLEDTGIGEQVNIFRATKACPCTLDALCKGASNNHIINHWDCRFTKYRPAWWYFVHGGAGAIVSAGLMRRATYVEIENKIWNQQWYASGDSAFTDAVWDKMRVLPTDPGPGYFREHLRLFDPGWKGAQAKGGAQDTDTEDWGNDPPGLMERFELAFTGQADAETLEQLDWVVTSHIRSRYIGADLNMEDVRAMAATDSLLNATAESLQPAAYVHLHMAKLAAKYAAQRTGKGQ